MNLEAFWGTDPGRSRDHNEDAIRGTLLDYAPAAARGHLFMVADGMGGHNAGEIASNEAVKRVYDRYYADTDPDLFRSLERAMRIVNNELFLQAQAEPTQQGMGTTMTAAVIQGNHLIVAHVGDSRLYLVRQGKIEQVTHDHSWVEEQVRAGVLTRLQAESHPQRNVIMRALATGPDVQVDREERDLQPGDLLVYGSDGLNTEVSDAQIAAQVTKASSAAEAVQRLIQLANDNGGEDNVSVGVIRIAESGTRASQQRSPAPAGQRRSLDKRRMVAIIGGAAALALIGGLIWAGISLLSHRGDSTNGTTATDAAPLRVPASPTSPLAHASATPSMTATLTLAPGMPTVTLQPTHAQPAASAAGRSPSATDTPNPEPAFSNLEPKAPSGQPSTGQAKKAAPVLLSPASGATQSETAVRLAWEPSPGTSMRANEGYAVLLWIKGSPDDGHAGLDLPALNDACNREKLYTATTFLAPMKGRGDITYRWAVIVVDASQPEPGGRCAVVSEMPSPFEFVYKESSSGPPESKKAEATLVPP